VSALNSWWVVGAVFGSWLCGFLFGWVTRVAAESRRRELEGERARAAVPDAEWGTTYGLRRDPLRPRSSAELEAIAARQREPFPWTSDARDAEEARGGDAL